MTKKQYYAHIDENDQLVAFVFSQEGLPEGHKALPLPEEMVPETTRYVAGELIHDSSDMDEEHNALLTKAALAKYEQYITPGKDYVYAMKMLEVILWDINSQNLGRTTKDSVLQATYPFAYWDSQAQGDTVEDAIRRFKEAGRASIQALAKAEATLQSMKK